MLLEKMDRRIWTHAERLDRKAQSVMWAYAGATAATFDGTTHPKEDTGKRQHADVARV